MTRQAANGGRFGIDVPPGLLAIADPAHAAAKVMLLVRSPTSGAANGHGAGAQRAHPAMTARR
jgi:hypothetical protein